MSKYTDMYLFIESCIRSERRYSTLHMQMTKAMIEAGYKVVGYCPLCDKDIVACDSIPPHCPMCGHHVSYHVIEE